MKPDSKKNKYRAAISKSRWGKSRKEIKCGNASCTNLIKVGQRVRIAEILTISDKQYFDTLITCSVECEQTHESKINDLLS